MPKPHIFMVNGTWYCCTVKYAGRGAKTISEAYANWWLEIPF